MTEGATDFRGERNLALEDTVNTEAFTSPKEDLFTSSPNNHDDPNNNQLMFNERDAQIVQVPAHLPSALQQSSSELSLVTEPEADESAGRRDAAIAETKRDTEFVAERVDASGQYAALGGCAQSGPKFGKKKSSENDQR